MELHDCRTCRTATITSRQRPPPHPAPARHRQPWRDDRYPCALRPDDRTPTANANGGLNLTGTAEANSVVNVYDGTTQIGTATANSSGVWGYTTGTLATGSHSLTARATDAAGNTGASSAMVTANTGTSPSYPTAPQIARSRTIAAPQATTSPTTTR